MYLHPPSTTFPTSLHNLSKWCPGQPSVSRRNKFCGFYWLHYVCICAGVSMCLLRERERGREGGREHYKYLHKQIHAHVASQYDIKALKNSLKKFPLNTWPVECCWHETVPTIHLNKLCLLQLRKHSVRHSLSLSSLLMTHEAHTLYTH